MLEKKERTLAIFGKKFGITRARSAVGILRNRKVEAQQTLSDLEDLETIMNGLWQSLDETLDEIDKVGELIGTAVADARKKAQARKVQLDKIFKEIE